MAWQWLKHAFAVETKDDFAPTAAELAAADRVCREVASRGLATPAILFLEMSRPLNNLGAQALHFFQPMLDAFTDSEGPKRFAEFLERRGSIDYLCDRLTELQRAAGEKSDDDSRPPP